MKRYVCGGVVLMGLLFAGNAFGDGNRLLRDCESAVKMDGASRAVEVADGMFCLGMMQGITNLNKLYEMQLGKEALFCTPKSGIPNGQAARIVVKYLREHPEKLHEHELYLALEAFREAFPCK